jgi:hypothetical protein
MLAWSGSDGPFNTVSEGGYPTVYQAQGTPGAYSLYMYFLRPAGVNFTAGAPLYVEVDYLDESGDGNLGIQYNAVGAIAQNAGFMLNGSVLNTGAYKSAVFRLDNADFAYQLNGGTDMRLTQAQGNFQFNIIDVTVSDAPNALYQQDTAFLAPYTGPTYAGGAPVDASTVLNKLVCGYQGWYGAPGDTDNVYWSHWSGNPSVLLTSTLQIDPWPDMAETTAPEQFAAPGFTNSGGGQTALFSSDMQRTVLRHFQWMEAWGIDGVAAQRFLVSSASPSYDRVLTYIRQAANQTGRVYYVQYDMSGEAEADITPTMSADWTYLVDTLRITSDPSYLHQNGLPVVGVFGFYPARFSSATGQAVINIFSATGPTPAYFAGSGDWTWRTSWAADWLAMLYTMGSWQPWNTGNMTSPLGTTSPPNYANTSYWAADKAQLAAHNVLYVPQVYPGLSSVNRDALAAGDNMPRLQGGVLWAQFAAAYALGAQSVYLGMFDEFSEGTQIAKTSNAPPTQPAWSITNEGLPSDCYLCFTSLGSKMLKGQYAYTTITPNCAGLTQPTIPDPIAPLSGAVLPSGSVAFSWTAALALSGGGTLTGYQILLNGVTTTPGSLATAYAVSLAPGTYVWRVRAQNSLGNSGGWSIAQIFTVSGPAWTSTPTLTPTAGPSLTPGGTPQPSRTPTNTPSASPTLTAAQTAAGTATPTPFAGNGTLIRGQAWPDPNPGQIQLYVDGVCPALTLKVFSTGLQAVAVLKAQDVGPGWARLSLPAQFLADASSGTYFYRISTDQKPRSDVLGTFVVLR